MIINLNLKFITKENEPFKAASLVAVRSAIRVAFLAEFGRLQMLNLELLF